jgi:hypothetical protein
MTASTRDIEGDVPEQPAQTHDSPEAAVPATGPGANLAPDSTAAPVATPSDGGQSLLMNAPADRCRVCSAELAPDQHYCVECGTRRGKPRFTLDKGTTSSSPSTSAAPSVIVAGWTKVSGLLAIAVVLLALGIGVLIGNAGGGTTSSSTTAAKAKSSSSPNSCTAGTAGCKNGKQTGNFFSSGS